MSINKNKKRVVDRGPCSLGKPEKNPFLMAVPLRLGKGGGKGPVIKEKKLNFLKNFVAI